MLGANPTRAPRAPSDSWWLNLARVGAPAEGSIPGPGWPDLHTVDYLTKVLTLALLLLALPWVLGNVFKSPRKASKAAAGTAPGTAQAVAEMT